MIKKNVAFLNSLSEYNILKNKKNLKEFIIISNSPELINKKKNIYSFKEFVGEKNFFYFDNHKFRVNHSKFLKKVDMMINHLIKKEFNFLFNTLHQQTKFLSYATNYYIFYKKIQRYKFNYLFYFEYKDKNKKITNHEMEILDHIVGFSKKNKIKINKLSGNASIFEEGCFEKNINNFSYEDYSIKRRVLTLTKNLKQEFFNNSKKNICLMNLSREQLVFFYKNFSSKYNLILFNNYLKYDNVIQTRVSEKKFFNYLFTVKDKKFFNSINCDDVLLNVLIKNYYNIFNSLYYRYFYAQKKFISLNKKYKFKKFIYGIELPVANYINSLFNKKNIKSLALSHGGTIGHYQNWPCVFYYTLKNKNSYYQIFSNNFKNPLKKILKVYSNNNFNNLTVIPSFDLISLKQSQYYKINQSISKKIKKVCYICSKNFNFYDLKKKIHSNEDLFLLRKKILKIFKKKANINFTIKNYPNEKFLFSNKKIYLKNVNFINKGNVRNLNSEFDLFILEAESSSLIETLCLKKKIICLQRYYPKFLEMNFKKLNKRVIFCKNKYHFLQSIENQLNKKIIDRVRENTFANDYYNIDDINQNVLKKSMFKFLKKI